jgi:hypothetical protein
MVFTAWLESRSVTVARLSRVFKISMIGADERDDGSPSRGNA